MTVPTAPLSAPRPQPRSLVAPLRPLFSIASLSLALLVAGPLATLRAQPAEAPLMTLDELHPGQKGEVWTVFRGTEPEPFSVEVTGVIRNALGPGKSIILCELTDERVQKMGAVAGMSGSPLYIDGKLAGALSYQVQRFETVRYAGFTPIADLMEVGAKAEQAELAARRNSGAGSIARGLPEAVQPPPSAGTAAGVAPSALSLWREDHSSLRGLAELPGTATETTADPAGGLSAGLAPLTPVFTASGLSPRVLAEMAPRFAAVGIPLASMGGSTTAGQSGGDSSAAHCDAPAHLRAGDAVSVAVATGDISLAATGTVSRVEGDRVLAFGHPMMSLGDVELPMASAEIVGILPSTLSSFKVANTGPIIGTVNQDRLSAIHGELGTSPPMVPVEITLVDPTDLNGRGSRTLRFEVARHPQLTPLVIGAGALQAVTGNNDAGLTQGLRLTAEYLFSDGSMLPTTTVLAGPQGITQGITAFASDVSTLLNNPWASAFPTRVRVRAEPLAENPLTTLNTMQLSRSSIGAGDTLVVSLNLSEFQGSTLREQVSIPVQPEWAGHRLQVVVTDGSSLDLLTGRRAFSAAQIRSFDSFAEIVREARPSDGLYVAVVEPTALFMSEAESTQELPGSLARIAAASDQSRFQNRTAYAPLWETRILPGRVVPGTMHRSLVVTD